MTEERSVSRSGLITRQCGLRTTTARTGWIVIFVATLSFFLRRSRRVSSFALGVGVRLLYLFHVRFVKMSHRFLRVAFPRVEI